VEVRGGESVTRREEKRREEKRRGEERSLRFYRSSSDSICLRFYRSSSDSIFPLPASQVDISLDDLQRARHHRLPLL
jgi:hypothetical protein